MRGYLLYPSSIQSHMSRCAAKRRRISVSTTLSCPKMLSFAPSGRSEGQLTRTRLVVQGREVSLSLHLERDPRLPRHHFSSIIRAVAARAPPWLTASSSRSHNAEMGVEHYMSSDACSKEPPTGLLRGVEEFNRGEFYACHDTLEKLWMAEHRPIRQLYQGILQIGVAFYHLQSGRYWSALGLLERGSGYLGQFGPTCMSVDVGGLLDDSARCLAQVKRLGPDGLKDFDWSWVPQIRNG